MHESKREELVTLGRTGRGLIVPPDEGLEQRGRILVAYIVVGMKRIYLWAQIRDIYGSVNQKVSPLSSALC